MKPRSPQLLACLLSVLFFGCGQNTPVTSQAKLNKAQQELAKAKSPQGRFYALNDAAKQTFVIESIGPQMIRLIWPILAIELVACAVGVILFLRLRNRV